MHWDLINLFSCEGFSSELRKSRALIYSVNLCDLWLNSANLCTSWCHFQAVGTVVRI